MDKEYIIQKLSETGFTQLALAKYMDLDPTIINKIVKGKRGIKAEEADKIRTFFNDILTEDAIKAHNVQLVSGSPSTVPLIGNVQAGAYIEAFELEPMEHLPIIGELTKYKNTFALRVLGDSMDKVYPEGTLLICQQLSDMAADLRDGHRVIVKKRATGDLFEVTVKEYSHDGHQKVLTPLSHNPKYKKQRISNGNIDLHQAGAPDLEVWAVVIAAYSLEI